MPNDATGIFCNERNRKCMSRSQSADDELLGLMAVGVGEKSSPSDLLNRSYVGRRFRADSERHGVRGLTSEVTGLARLYAQGPVE